MIINYRAGAPVSRNKPIRKAAGLCSALMVAMFFCGPMADAQKSTAPMPDQGRAENTIQVRKNLVIVRVVVRDKKGNSVSGLSRRDFRVFDNKKEYPIEYFSAETPAVMPPALTEPSARHLENSPATKPVAGQTAPSSPQRYTALFFDDYHMRFANLAKLREAVERYLDKNLDQGARVAMYSTSGRVHIDFTNDRAKLEQAAAQLQYDLRFEPAYECPPMTDLQAQEIDDNNFMERDPDLPPQPGKRLSPYLQPILPNGSGSSPGVVGPLAVAGAVAAVLKCGGENLQHLRARAHDITVQNREDDETTLRALDGLVRRMSATPGGERTIAMVSEGFLNKEFEQKWDALIDHALRAKVIINALDAVGLYSPQDQVEDALTTALPSDAAKSMSLAEAYAHMRVDAVNGDADVMAQVAEGTGGIFIKNSNDFEGGLEQMTVPYTVYEFGFSPKNLKSDGKFHVLKVKLPKFKHYRVQARRGYFDPRKTDDVAASHSDRDELERAVFSRDDLNALPVRFSTMVAKADQQTTNFSVTVHVDMDSLSFRKEGGRNMDEIEFALALFNGDGNYVNGRMKALSLDLSDSELKRLKRTGATVTVAVIVKPGSYLARAVLLDDGSQRMGSGTENITIP